MLTMNKIQEIMNGLNNKYYERSGEIEALLIGMLARQHVLFIGDAGTGKSMLSAELNNIVEGSNYFQWLLNQFSTPDEIFGVLDLKHLEQGIYKRNTEKKMPEAHFAFLDEIFKANSAILNSLLTIINERVFYNNGSPVKTPLMSIVGSSNEYPEEGEGLEALFDRFLLRYEVGYIKEESSFISMLKEDTGSIETPKITMNELDIYQMEVDFVSIPDDVFHILAEIRQDLADAGIRPSDRRFKQSLSLLKAKAFIDGRNQVLKKDIKLLKNALWVSPDQQEVTQDIVLEYASNLHENQFEAILQDYTDLSREFAKSDSTSKRQEIMKKFNAILGELRALKIEDEAKKARTINEINEQMVAFSQDVVQF